MAGQGGTADKAQGGAIGAAIGVVLGLAGVPTDVDEPVRLGIGLVLVGAGIALGHFLVFGADPSTVVGRGLSGVGMLGAAGLVVCGGTMAIHQIGPEPVPIERVELVAHARPEGGRCRKIDVNVRTSSDSTVLIWADQARARREIDDVVVSFGDERTEFVELVDLGPDVASTIEIDRDLVTSLVAGDAVQISFRLPGCRHRHVGTFRARIEPVSSCPIRTTRAHPGRSHDATPVDPQPGVIRATPVFTG